MPDPQTPQDPQVKDPGLFVTTAEIQSYAYAVDKLIHDINARVLAHEGKPGASVLPLESWAKWVKFRLDWEGKFAAYKDPGWLAWGSSYDTIRSFHLEALKWKEAWAGHGVDMGGIVAPQPGTYHVEPPDVTGALSSLFSWPLVLGAGVLAYMLGRKA